jgi:hypothetical protein
VQIAHPGATAAPQKYEQNTIFSRFEVLWVHAARMEQRSNGQNSYLLIKLLAGISVIEMFVRLGLALFISLALALLFAWGWHHSDQAPAQIKDLAMADSSTVHTVPH